MISHGSNVYLSQCGCATALGDRESTHAALLGGVVGLRLAPVLGAKGGDPVPLALIPGRGLDEEVPPAWMGPLLAMAAPVRSQAWGTARRPVCIASSNFGVGSLYGYVQSGSPQALDYSTPQRCVDWIRRQMDWGAHVAIFSHACVSAHIALLHASRLLEAGAADEALVFSFDFLSPFVAGGFHALKILNGAMPSPYQAAETGAIGLGDGAAYAVVTRERRDLVISAQNVHNEMFHFTANEPSGAGFEALLKPMNREGARLWFKGHGTGTIEAGRLESAVAARMLPGSPIVGWKGSLGHTLGSCGLVELALAAQALQTGRTPGTVGSRAPLLEPAVALSPFDNRAFDGALCTSNAFGGAHAALVIRHA